MCDAIKSTILTLLLIFGDLGPLGRLFLRTLIEVKLRVRCILKRHLVIENGCKMLHDGRLRV